MRNILAIAAIIASLVATACGGGAAPSAAPSSAPATQAGASASAAPKPAIKLGAIIPLTGPSGATGQDMKEGYELAKEQVNAKGGVNGQLIEVIYEDDKNDNATAVASFDKLVNSDKVEVMMGGLASGVSAALVEPAKKAAIPMAWTGAASSALVEKGFTGQSFFFHYHPWDYMNAQSSEAFLKSTGYTNWAVVYEDGAFGTAGAQGFKTDLPKQGQQVVAAEAFKTGSTDFTALLNRVKSANPDGLLIIPYAGDMIPMLTQMREVGLKVKIIYASPPSFPPDFGKSPVAEGVAGLTLWTADIPAPASKQFVADFQKKYNKLPGSYWAPLAYTNLITVVDALKKSGTGNKAAWITAMEETSYASPIGPTLKFTKSQVIDHQGFTSLVSFQWQAGKQEIVFPADLATAKAK